MVLSRVVAAFMVLSAVCWAQGASAFTVDDQSMNNAASANFSDPDEKMPSPTFSISGGQNQFNGNGDSQQQNSNLPPSAVAPALMPFPPHR